MYGMQLIDFFITSFFICWHVPIYIFWLIYTDLSELHILFRLAVTLFRQWNILCSVIMIILRGECIEAGKVYLTWKTRSIQANGYSELYCIFHTLLYMLKKTVYCDHHSNFSTKCVIWTYGHEIITYCEEKYKHQLAFQEQSLPHPVLLN